ncbi:hypothetical protein AAEU32_11015 [Pseudoalteromonas sp. SSDWG2]|uniref:hypothetical protein n=1 Tax=Pseudoalteromonas sp. SSDWG2 TaxID=3139391 RepID=UPI003BADBB31
MKKSIILLLFFVSFILNAYDGWSGANKVSTIRVYSGEYVLITMANANNPSQCSDSNYIMLKNTNTESGQRQYSALLSAYMAGKQVNLALTGCSQGGTSGYPLIEQVWLQ